MCPLRIQKMTQKKWDILFIGVCAFFLILFFGVKFYGPLVVENIHQGGNFETLNKITGLEQQQSFYVYLGYIEERFLGPISQVISGFLLILIGLRNIQL